MFRLRWERFRSPRRCSRVLLIGVILIVGALTFFPALSLGPILEHLLMEAGKDFLRTRDYGKQEFEKDKLWDSEDRAARDPGIRFVKLNPRTHDGQSRDVRGGGRAASITTVLLSRRDRPGALQLQSADHALAVVHRAVRQLRRSHGGRPRQGAGRHAAQGALGDHGQPPAATMAAPSRSPARSCARATWSWSRPASSFRRWRDHRRRGVGGRVGDHRRVRARDSRSRRRSFGRDRRHARALRSDQGAGSLPIPARPSSIA